MAGKGLVSLRDLAGWGRTPPDRPRGQIVDTGGSSMSARNQKIPTGCELRESVEAIGRRIGCSIREVYRLRREGGLRALDDGAGCMAYRTPDLDRLRESYLTPQQRQALRVDAICLGIDRYVAGVDARLARMEPTRAARPGRRMTLSSAAIDTNTGILRGVVVMAGGVPAAGKFVLVDGSGAVTKDPAKARRRLPTWTDARSLHSLLAAVREVGGRLKTRIDHNDSIEARAACSG